MKAGVFLADARGRLLPLSLPLRFFGAAVVYHLVGWLALWAAADTWLVAPSAPGWPLAALHAFTLGVLVMTALGAATQLLPVATRQAVPPAAWLAGIWWLFTPGVAVLLLGMAWVRPWWLAAGAAAVVLALALWMGLVAHHLRGARGMPGVVWHGRLALLALAATVLAALWLVSGWFGAGLAAREWWLGLHRLAGPWGFMGLLSLGVAYILVPMFALGDVPSERLQGTSAAAAALALLAAVAALATSGGEAGAAGAAGGAAGVAGAVAGLSAGLWWLALAAAACAVLLHLRGMQRTLAVGLRQRLGRSFVLVRIGWAGLLASLALAAAHAAGAAPPRWPAALGLCIFGVWLLSLLLGLMQRIVPFLAAMHGGRGRRNPTPAALTHERALQVHFACHLAALTQLGAAVALDEPWLVRSGAATGAIGAAAFATFFFAVVERRRRSASP